MKEAATMNTPLPPSMEKAYHQKCIELKRRLGEIESSNDAARLRKRRLDRAIEKLRLERAFLYERLAKVQGFVEDDSDKETSPPPTPQERPSRRPRAAPPGRGNSFGPGDAPLPSSPTAAAGAQHSQDKDYGGEGSQSDPAVHAQQIDRRAPSQVPSSEPLPEITWLPARTNVIMIGGEPKQPPWTIRDIAPRHHLRPGFEDLSLEEQRYAISADGYLPYDIQGNPVLVAFGKGPGGKAIHVFKDDPEWTSPVHDGVRTDDPFSAQAQAEQTPAPSSSGFKAMNK